MSDIVLKKTDFDSFLGQYAVHKVLRDNNRFNFGNESIRLAIWDNRDNCQFIYVDGKKAGGALLDVGMIKHPFIYPDFRDFLPEILETLHITAMEGADLEKGVMCLPSDSEQAEIYFNLGYGTIRKLRCMIGPLSNLGWKCPEGYFLRQPSENDIQLIGKLFYRANINDPWHKPVTPEGFIRGTKRYFNPELVDNVLAASSICCEERTGNPVGGCMISMDEAFPFVYDLHILEKHRRKGIGTAMMKKAMRIMSKDHAYMRLFVIDGNPAAKLYYRLGFIAGNPVYIMNYKLGN
jgi:GNAT superfamily N-acetyltransferase